MIRVALTAFGLQHTALALMRPLPTLLHKYSKICVVSWDSALSIATGF